MTRPLDKITTAAHWVLDQGDAALKDTAAQSAGLPAAPDAQRIHFGPAESVVWDNWCEPSKPGVIPGQMTVAFVEGWPSTLNFPDPDPPRSGCATAWAIPMTLEVVRCTPGLEEGGEAPDWEALENDTEQRAAELEQLLCWFQSVLGGTYEGVVTDWTTIVSGYLRAVRVTMTIQVP